MAKFDSDEILEKVRLMMQGLKSWPVDNLSWKQKAVRFSWMSLLIFAALGALIESSRVDDFDIISFGIFAGTLIINVLIKYTILFYNKSRFRGILKNLKNPLILHHEEYVDILLVKRVGESELFRNVYAVACMAAVVIVIVSPVPYLKSDRRLPIPLPLDVRKQPTAVYILVWGLQSIITFIAGWTTLSYDVMSITFMQIAVAQLEMLKERIINITDGILLTKSTRKHMYTEAKDTIVNNRLRTCIMQHVAIERYIDSVQNTFAFAFLSQLAASVVLICLMGFSSVLVPVVSLSFAKSTILFVSLCIQIAIFCLPASQIILQSEQIRYACYMTEWNMCSTSVGKALLLMMQRCSRPFSLSAANFVTLSHGTFLSILNSSFSYFSVLWHLYKNSTEDLNK